MSWDRDDYWDSLHGFPRYPPPPSPPLRRPSPHHHNSYRRSGYLSPEPHYAPFGSSLHRSRSSGHGPNPKINIYNHMDQVNDQHQRAPAYPPPPDLRGRRDERLGDRLVDDLLAAEIAEMRFDRLARSRSRGKSDAPIYEHVPRRESPNYYKWQLEQRDRDLREVEQKRLADKEQERMRTEYELRRAQDEAKRKRATETAEEERKRIILEHEKAVADRAKAAKEEERRVLEKMERDKREAAEEERRLLDKMERDRKDAKEREERQWKEFEQKQKEKRLEEERQAKAEKEALDTQMRDRLLKAGYSLEAIEEILDPSKKKAKKKSKDDIVGIIDVPSTGDMILSQHSAHVPVYAKIHKKYLDTQTLQYYRIPYEFDRANSDFIIILREMSKEDTNVLFEHTRRLRKGGRLLLEPAKKEKREFQWVRPKRDRSKSIGRRDIRLVEVRR